MKASEATALCDSLAATIGPAAFADFGVELGLLAQEYTRQHERRQRRSVVLDRVTKCGGSVTTAAESLGITGRAVYYHLEATQKLKSPA